LKFESFAQKTWFIKVLILRPKMPKNSPTSTFNFKKIRELYPRTTVKRGKGGKRGMGGEGKGRRGRGQGRGGPNSHSWLRH